MTTASATPNANYTINQFRACLRQKYPQAAIFRIQGEPLEFLKQFDPQTKEGDTLAWYPEKNKLSIGHWF